jgi:hypothetical protein
MKSLVKYVIDNGGSIQPLIIPTEKMTGVALMNPSVYMDGNQLKVNIRNCNYTLYHSENNKFEHEYGPLQYLHAENDITLTTWNYICELNDDLSIKNVIKVDTKDLDTTPQWNFIGLEDARLVRWKDSLTLIGVRRDTTPNGIGRMEMSLLDDEYKEKARFRIPTPENQDSYCEKNWMPVIDKPGHFVKWTNPTHVVKYVSESGTTETVVLDESTFIPGLPDFRGGSQVLPYNGGYIALVHQTHLFDFSGTRKNAIYKHRFVIWDKDFKVIKYTEPFSFMGSKIEFCCGATFQGDDLVVSFGFQDNCSFLLKIPKNVLSEILELQYKLEMK